MTKPTTLRLPDELLEQLDARAKAHGKDRASFLRELLRDALERDIEREVLQSYAEGRLSFTEACRRTGLDEWRMLERLRERNLRLNVSLEDWIDSRSSL